jgi:hypothetical protein
MLDRKQRQSLSFYCEEGKTKTSSRELSEALTSRCDERIVF